MVYLRLPTSLAVIFGSFTLGLYVAIQGPTLMDLIDILHINNDIMSYSLAFSNLAYSIGGLLSGFLFNYVNRQILVSVYFIIFGVANALTPFMTNYTLFSIVFVFKMMCAGGTDCAANVWILELWPGQDSWLQALHFAFACGCALGPLIVEPFLGVDYNKENEIDKIAGKTSGSTIISDQNGESRIYIPYGFSGATSVGAAIYFLYLYYLNERHKKRELMKLNAKQQAAAGECILLTSVQHPAAIEAGLAKSSPVAAQLKEVKEEEEEEEADNDNGDVDFEEKDFKTRKKFEESKDEHEEEEEEEEEETNQKQLLNAQQLASGGYQTPSPPPPHLAITINNNSSGQQQQDNTNPQHTSLNLNSNQNQSQNQSQNQTITMIDQQQQQQQQQQNSNVIISNNNSNLANNILSQSQSLIPQKITSKARKEQVEGNGRPPYYVMFAIALAALSLSFYCGIEITSMNYLATFAVNIDLQLPKSTAAYMSSALTISFAVGRLIGIFVAAKVRPHILFYLCAAIMALGNLLMFIFANTAEMLLWYSICLFGIGCGPMFPAIVSFYDDKISKVTNTVSGIFILGSMFNVALNTLIIGHHIIDNALILITCNLIGSIVLLLLFGTLHLLTKVKKNQRVRKYKLKQQQQQQQQQQSLLQNNQTSSSST